MLPGPKKFVMSDQNRVNRQLERKRDNDRSHYWFES